MLYYCEFCTKNFLESESSSVTKSNEILFILCPHCKQNNYFKDVEIRCPACAQVFKARLGQPTYYSGGVECSCEACKNIFTLHLDNFVQPPRFEISYSDFILVLKNCKFEEWNRFLQILQIKKLAHESTLAEEWQFFDKQRAEVMSLASVYERVLANRDVCHAFYGLLMSEIR